MFILKLIEWLGEEREKDETSTLDADVIFLSIMGFITFGIWMLDKIV